jgi:hypothetical protein
MDNRFGLDAKFSGIHWKAFLKRRGFMTTIFWLTNALPGSMVPKEMKSS